MREKTDVRVPAYFDNATERDAYQSGYLDAVAEYEAYLRSIEHWCVQLNDSPKSLGTAIMRIVNSALSRPLNIVQ